MSLVVVRAIGLVTVQDLGRRGHMHEAVPPGGALVRSLLVAANRAVDNADDAPAIELAGQLVLRAESPLVLAIDEARRTLAAGDELTITSGPRRATYLAVRGGIEAPLVLGGRGTLLCAQLGRLLRAGDRLAVADTDPVHARPVPVAHGTAIRVIPGPDLDAFTPDALATLLAAPYRISPTSDRVGTRLAGAPIPRRPDVLEASRPMVRGALEVPADGQPIVLGPEHPTTGGYPVLAVVMHDDLDRLFAIPLGRTLTFTVAR